VRGHARQGAVERSHGRAGGGNDDDLGHVELSVGRNAGTNCRRS
jgi:hypothetical protein